MLPSVIFSPSHRFYVSSSPSRSITLDSSLFTLAFAMKDPPHPLAASVFLPHQHIRSVVPVPPVCNSHGAPSTSFEVGGQQAAVLNPESSALAQLHHQQQPPRQWKRSSSAHGEEVCENGSDRHFETPSVPVSSYPYYESGTFHCSDINEWKHKLTMLLHDEGKQELISREKKDRRNFDQIAALANTMGLYSRSYTKVVVFSKYPLPNYRFDLDDKRPQREVSLNLDLCRRVNAYLGEYLDQKSKRTDLLSDNSFFRSTSTGSIASDEGLLELPEPVAFSKTLEKIMWQRSVQLRDQQQAWQQSPEGRRIMEFRRSLPVYKERDSLLTAITQNQVIIVSGETGCGKTTQIPQIILESETELNRGAVCNIICTQPRRISAMSVSERVALERGEKLGESVGYKIRLEGAKGKDTRLLFCTTGILLRRLLADKNLKGVTHVIVDEIHERGMDEDFLLIILKDLLPRRPNFRLILMSATLDAELFSSYFGGAPVICIPGFIYPVRTLFLENILEMTCYRLTPYNQVDDYGQEKMWKMNKHTPGKQKSQIASAVEKSLSGANFEEFSLQTRESLSCWNPDCMGFNLIEFLLCYICENERPGAILVFMTGWDDIHSLKDKLQKNPILGNPDRVLLLGCHGSMASSEQRLIFEEPVNGARKIVLATNIAETSITINDVVFVIDCGKAKESSYDALNNTPCLLPSWISKVSAQQRRGRAGRVQPGECFHLYPRCVYDAFPEYQLPEILRTPLQSLCLQIKCLNLGSISEFLSRALQSPELLAVQNAIEYLKIIGALDEKESLTVLGRYISKLPVEPKLGKMLILGAIFDCLDPVLTVVAGLSVRDPFLAPVDKKDLAEAAKTQFLHDYSDHLTLVRAYEGWKDAERNFGGYDYCWKNFLSAQSMKAIDSLRLEIFSLLKDTGLIDGTEMTKNVWRNEARIIQAVICYGLYPGICSIMHSGCSFAFKTMEDGQVLLHSNSVNARQQNIPYPWLVFNAKIKVKTIFLRDSTAVSDSILLLFGGGITNGDMDGHLKMLGGYLEFFMNPAVAEMYQTLKKEIDGLMQNKLLNPKMDMQVYQKLLCAMKLLVSEDQCDGKFVFGRQVLKSSVILPATPSQPILLSRSESGPGGDNSKNQLQTLMARAGYATPSYMTKQLENNQFQSIVEFNGMQITGQPCGNKKNAEKDAAAKALHWLFGGAQPDSGFLDKMSLMLKRSKKTHH